MMMSESRGPEPAIRLPLRNKAGDTVAHALISTEDGHLAQYRWHRQSTGYVRRAGGKRGVYVYLHREIMGRAKGDGTEVDHIDGDPLNCRRSNLRVVTHAENKKRLNAAGYANNKAGYRGVHWHSTHGKWGAEAKLDGVKHYLGLYDTPEDAHAVVERFRDDHNMPSFRRTEAVT